MNIDDISRTGVRIQDKSLAKSCFLLLFMFTQFAAAKPRLNYIYIESSEGNASGGHSALQLGEDVFHYQYYPGGLIILEKAPLDNFEFAYRYLANRSLHVSQIEVSDETYALLHEHFNFRYQIQKQQLALLDQLTRDRALLTQLLRKDADPHSLSLSLKGAGLFFSHDDGALTATRNIAGKYRSPDLMSLQNEIKQHFGEQFFFRRRAELMKKMRQLHPPIREVNELALQLRSYPPTVYSFADQYQDLYIALLALRVIEESRILLPDAYVRLSDAEFRLTDKEIATLSVIKDRLRRELLVIMDSTRPDWGYAVMVYAARLITISESIRLRRMVFVNTFTEHTESADDIHLSTYTLELRRHVDETLQGLRRNRLILGQQAALTEQNYSRLEMLANRYLELLKAATQKKPIRYHLENLLPEKSLSLTAFPGLALTRLELETALRQLEQYQEVYQKQLQQLYAYQLLTRNCVTELFAAISEVLLSTSGKAMHGLLQKQLISLQSHKRLGGDVASVPFNFIPFISYNAVRDNYTIAQSRVLPAFRLQQMTKMYARENNVLVFLRESNTLSSKIYKVNPDDSFFIFFTDNALLLHPFYGAVNTLAGLGQTLIGLLSWPLDSGTMLRSGASGMLMSIPELVFVNMRKGSFRYLPYSYQQDGAEMLRETKE